MITKKQSSWVWFLLAILPVILILTNQITSDIGNANIEPLFDRLGFYCDYNETQQGTYTIYTITFEEPSTTSLDYTIYKLIEKLMQQSDNYFIPQYIAYLIRLNIMHIALQVFIMLPNICSKLMNRLMGVKENE